MSKQPTRFYGLALGKEGNFSVTTDGLITSTDATPSVATKSLFYTNNASATTITDFDDGTEGQLITLIALDAVTTLSNGTVLLDGGSDYAMGVNDSVTLIKHSSNWFELARSQNADLAQAISALQPASSQTVSAGAKIISITATSAGVVCTLNNLSGGVVGQEIFIRSGSTGVIVKVLTGNNIMLATTDGVSIDTDNCLHLIKIDDGNWMGTEII